MEKDKQRNRVKETSIEARMYNGEEKTNER